MRGHPEGSKHYLCSARRSPPPHGAFGQEVLRRKAFVASTRDVLRPTDDVLRDNERITTAKHSGGAWPPKGY